MWMLYGATGYTGRITAKLARERGLEPILAARSEEKLRPLAQSLALQYRAFDLEDPVKLRQNLAGVAAVLHMAGPFSSTSSPMVDACLASGCHYLDISGEVAVYESIWPRQQQAVQAGVVLLPGVGFDVVPTDCVAAMLHDALPDATALELAFVTLGSKPSPGTTKTWIEGLAKGGLVRESGQLKQLPLAGKTRKIEFPSRPRHCLALPLGDVSSAYITTGIPNIVVYVAMPERATRVLAALGSVRGVLGNQRVQRLLKRLVGWGVRGASAEARKGGRTEVWGEAKNDSGEVVTAALTTPDGYTFTADSSLRCLERALSGQIAPGATTVGKALGGEFVAECDGVEVELRPRLPVP
jgi:saccharopine dehydrogenase (NAD+, L-lysine-forming)